jgi:hypothetical protein
MRHVLLASLLLVLAATRSGENIRARVVTDRGPAIERLVASGGAIAIAF